MNTAHRMKAPIVVTGATGRTGRAIPESLLAAGQPVRVVGRNAETLKPFALRGAEIYAGSLKDRAYLTNAFRGAKAAYVMTALDVHTPDIIVDQYEKAESIAAAVRDAQVEYVVFTSSWGAELTEKSGGIIGCHRLEALLSEIPSLNVVFLRPVWFMENFLWNIGLIKMADINGLTIRPNLAFPMIAADDIASAAVEYLANPVFKGRNIRYLMGPGDYTMVEVTRILGAAVGRPDLRYVKFPDAVFRKGLISSGGLTPHAANMAIEINHGIDSGYIHAEPRSTANTTPTTLEQFAKTTFAPAFAAAPKAGLTERFSGFFLRSFLSVTGSRAA